MTALRNISARLCWAAVASAFLCLPLAAQPKEPAKLDSRTLEAMLDSQGGAVFDGLDKITARVSTILAPLDVPVRYGSLSLTVRKCNARPPEEAPEKAAFVEIDEAKPGNLKRLFTGWMFWSSPALNPLEHPVYDVWLIECRMSPAERLASQPPPSTEDQATIRVPGAGETDAAPDAPPADDVEEPQPAPAD